MQIAAMPQNFNVFTIQINEMQFNTCNALTR